MHVHGHGHGHAPTCPRRSGRVASAKAPLKGKRGGLSPSDAQLTWLGLGSRLGSRLGLRLGLASPNPIPNPNRKTHQVGNFGVLPAFTVLTLMVVPLFLVLPISP